MAKQRRSNFISFICFNSLKKGPHSCKILKTKHHCHILSTFCQIVTETPEEGFHCLKETAHGPVAPQVFAGRVVRGENILSSFLRRLMWVPDLWVWHRVRVHLPPVERGFPRLMWLRDSTLGNYGLQTETSPGLQ